MRMHRKTGYFALMLLIGFLSFGAHSAQAQRSTRIYGSAYEQWWTGIMFTWDPYVKVYIWDDFGHNWTADTNLLSDWWLDNMPSNRQYHFQARSKGWPYPWSGVIDKYVPAKSWWQLNQTNISDLICR